MFWEQSLTEMMSFEVNALGWVVVAAFIIGVVVTIARYEKKKKENVKQKSLKSNKTNCLIGFSTV